MLYNKAIETLRLNSPNVIVDSTFFKEGSISKLLS